MKKLFTSLFLAALVGTGSFAQDSVPPLDKSPLDMSTYPANYAMRRLQEKTAEPLTVRVIYSRPQKNGRTIFGDLLEYGKVWRFGANEATEIEFFRDVKFGAAAVKKGRYTMYVIPNTDTWTVVLNKDLDTWGAFKYDQAKDVARIDVPVQKAAAPADLFYIYFEKLNKGCSMIAGWDDVKINLPITF